MNASQLLSKLIACEVDSKILADARRVLRQERMFLAAAIKRGDFRLSKRIAEIIYLASMRGVEL